MKKANRLRAIETVEVELRSAFNNRPQAVDRDEYAPEDFAAARFLAERRCRQLVNILRVLRSSCSS